MTFTDCLLEALQGKASANQNGYARTFGSLRDRLIFTQSPQCPPDTTTVLNPPQLNLQQL